MFRLVFILLCVKISFCEEENLPKCCPGSNLFTSNRLIYECGNSTIADPPLRIQIVDRNITEKNEKFCVDIESSNSVSLFKKSSKFLKVKDLNAVFFPKCCPLNFVYNPITHGCDENRNFQPFFNETFVKIGLPHCKIIKDIRLESSRSIDNVSKYNKMYSEGNFCVDKDINDRFIIRQCTTDYNICNFMKCVHKCCPDGQSFINGAKCYDTYTHGLNFTTFANNMDNIDGNYF